MLPKINCTISHNETQSEKKKKKMKFKKFHQKTQNSKNIQTIDQQFFLPFFKDLMDTYPFLYS